MQNIPTTRAAHVVEFCEILRDIGTPVERELAKAKLPILIEETPDELVSCVLATEFTAQCARLDGIDDLGWLGARNFATSQLSSDLVAALCTEPTVKGRLERFFALIRLEESHIRCGYGRINGSVRVIADMDLAETVQGLDISDWMQVGVLVETIRSVAGPDWCPDTISFKSDLMVSDDARAAFPNTRFRRNAQHTAIEFPAEHLAITAPLVQRHDFARSPSPHNEDGIETLRRLIRPYLRDAALPLAQAAEIAGKSPRSLQRTLKERGISYSRLVETARFEMAVEMLEDPGIRLIDIAQALGYEDQSNFGRCFRRISGMSPGRYRRNLRQLQLAAG